MIIDSHAHVLLPVEKQLAAMDEAGIERTILFSTLVHPEVADDLDSFKKGMSVLQDIVAGRQNPLAARIASQKEQAEVIKENPARFLGFGSVPLGLTLEETARWIEEQVIANGFLGLGEFTLAPTQVSLLEKVFPAAAELGKLPLWVHTFSPFSLADIKALHSLCKKFPQVPVILGHLGGVHWLETIDLAKATPNIYLDLSATFTIIAPTMAIKEIPERVLFGSDAPYGDPLLVKSMIERITPDKQVREQVLGENIVRLLQM